MLHFSFGWLLILIKDLMVCCQSTRQLFVSFWSQLWSLASSKHGENVNVYSSCLFHLFNWSFNAQSKR